MVAPLSLAAAAAPAPPLRLPRLGEAGWTALLMLAAALVLRLPQLGNPVEHLDDQFYLMTGRAMLEGELPYVDIWDRKPLGLFLIYAAIGLLGGGGVVQYQLVAALFAAATAFVVSRIAIRYTNPRGAALAGICYLASLAMVGGGGGQSPVFYNLFVATAALLVLKASAAPAGALLHRHAIGAMALCGLAVFTKQTAVVEGCFFGLVLLRTFWTKTRSPARVAGAALAFAACGVAPTLAAFAVYAALGHGEAFWFANVVSIFLKGSVGSEAVLNGLALILICLTALAACAAAGLAGLGWRGDGRPSFEATFAAGWVAAALAGFVMIPNFFDHYALPLVAPFSVAAAALFGRERRGRLWATFAILWGVVLSDFPAFTQSRVAAGDFARAEAVVSANLSGGCLYVHEGPVHLYTATGACRVTRHVFPDHLNSAPEDGATGIDADAEMRRILAARPQVIVTARRIVFATNRSTQRILDEGLRRGYRRVAISPVDLGGVDQILHIWVLNPETR